MLEDDLDTGAGDQGMMFGFACDESPELMPLPIALAHRLTRRLAEVRKNGTLPWLRPDGKSQVTVEYRYGVPGARRRRRHLDAARAGGRPGADRTRLTKHVIEPVVEAHLLDEETKYFINPTGRFVIGGPFGDSGSDRPQDHRRHLRRHGPPRRRRLLGQGPDQGRPLGGVRRALGGQERRRRWPGQALRGEPGLRHRRGSPGVSVAVETFGTETVPVEQIERAITETFDLRPAGIIKALDLRRPIFEQTAAYGHFGRTDLDVPWERTNKIDELKAAVGGAPVARQRARPRR